MPIHFNWTLTNRERRERDRPSTHRVAFSPFTVRTLVCASISRRSRSALCLAFFSVRHLSPFSRLRSTIVRALHFVLLICSHRLFTAMPHLRLVYTPAYSIIATITSPMIVPTRLSTMGMEKVHQSEYVAIGEELADRPEMDGRFEQNKQPIHSPWRCRRGCQWI